MGHWLSSFCISISIGAVGLSTAAWGTMLPQNYPLRSTKTRTNPLDPGLDKWLSSYYDKPSPNQMNEESLAKLLDGQDELTKKFVELRRENSQGKAKADSVKKAIEIAKGSISKTEDGKPGEAPILLPFLWNEILRSDGASEEDKKIGMAAILEHGKRSCAEKALIIDQITEESLKEHDAISIQNFVKDINEYKSYAFRRDAINKVLKVLPPDRRESMLESLYLAARPYSELLEWHKWLKKAELAVKEKEMAKEPLFSYFNAKRKSDKGHCSEAVEILKEGLSKAADEKKTLSEAKTSSSAISGCLRSNKGDVIAYWKSLESTFEKAYGLDGWAYVAGRIGYYAWNKDDFATAKQQFEQVKERALKENSPAWVADSIFTLARIAENEGEQADADKYYENYVANYPKEKDYLASLSALLLSKAADEKWDDTLNYSKKIIDSQDDIEFDSRDLGAVSFALFWAGRANLEKGSREEAVEHWRRLASEYYSSFYGALGHFMLEKMVGNKLLLEPSRTAKFSFDKYVAGAKGEERNSMKRAESFLKLGYRDLAVCELKEIAVSAKDTDKALAKALMLFAAKEWLDAIKIVGEMPRSYRNTLPAGFEKLLFPKSYTEHIEKLSQKANVDPDFVVALIRQESVFNSQAMSPVGARGLMQMMPATAKLETERLKGSYVNKKQRDQILKRLGSKNSLFDPELNLTLGVSHVERLLAKYKSPVIALSAYNAGPNAAERWVKEIPTKDLLIFIEKIPYRETRDYVKLILRNYFYYKRWYPSSKNNSYSHFIAVTQPLIKIAKAGSENSADAKGELQKVKQN